MSTRSKGDGSVFQLASGRWRGQVEAGFTPAGARRYRTVTGDTKADAVRKLRALQNKIAKEGVAAAPAALTVKRWSDTWLPIYQQTVRPTRYTDVRGVLRRYIVPTIGHKRLTALTPADVRAVHKATAAAGMGPHTALRSHDVLMVMLKAAMQEGAAVPANVLGVKRPQPGEPDRDAIPLPHALAILQAASSRPDASKWAAAFLQGLRQGERLGLTWECVDLDKGLIDVSWQLQRLPYDDREAGTFRVPVGFTARQLVGAAHLVRPKSRKGWRVIPLVPWMRDALQSWKETAPANPHGLVWAEDGRPTRKVTDADEWRELQDVAGVRHASGRYYYGHEARHTTATLLMTANVDPHTVTAILGHSSITTSRGYQHVDSELARRAMSEVARIMNIDSFGPPHLLEQAGGAIHSDEE